MKKNYLIVFFFVFSLFYAQDEEIDSIYSIYLNNKVKAYNLLKDIEKEVDKNQQWITPDNYAKYLYMQGDKAYNSGDIIKAADYFQNLAYYESNPIYYKEIYGKKNYSLEKEKNNPSVKEYIVNTHLYKNIIPMIINKKNIIENLAVSYYNERKYEEAAVYFYELYYLKKILGTDDLMDLFYSAVAYRESNQKNKSLSLFIELINKDFTGEKENYYAKNIPLGKEIALTHEQYLLLKNNKKYSNSRIEKTSSLVSDIYLSAIDILESQGHHEEAKKLLNKGIEKYPLNQELLKKRNY